MITTKVNLDFAGILDLGYQGENDARSFVFDVYEWMEHFQPGGSVRLLALRPGEIDSYPCVLEVDGNLAEWVVGLADMAIPGNGQVELQYAVGDTIVKSKRFRTSIGASIADPSGEVPKPQEPWVQQVLDAAERAAKFAKEAGEACNIFVAEYGVTTYAELKAAYAAGKFLVAICKNAPQPSGITVDICACLDSVREDRVTFTYSSSNHNSVFVCKESGWSYEYYLLIDKYAAKYHATEHSKDGSDPITPESIGAIPALGESIADPETNIDELTLTKCYLCGSTVIKNGLQGNLPFASSFLLKVDDYTGDGRRAIQTATKNNSTNPVQKWRLWNGSVWSPWQEG